MTHFFISYSKADTRELALALNEALNSIPGVTAWVDKSLKVGRSWPTQIQGEIDRCDYMIVLYSPDINRHRKGDPESFVLTEISYALYTARKPIIPIMAQKTDPPLVLTMTQYIDFTLKGISLADLVEAICEEAVSVHPAQVATAVLPNSSLDDFSTAVRGIIGEPFEWCEVSAGEFLFGDEKQAIYLPSFYIAKYPITYAQFQVFAEAKDGIKDDRWWAGLAEQHKILFEQSWKIANHPRENVNWYQVVAFCRWLSARLGSAYEVDEVAAWPIRLPTEAEWEKTARGTDGRIYPWGDQFDGKKCNVSQGIMSLFMFNGKTTPVDNYPNGASLYGTLDMSGNVREWCLSEWTNPYNHQLVKLTRLDHGNKRVQRSSSWGDNQYNACVTYRDFSIAGFTPTYVGFRVCGSAPIPSLRTLTT
jgi:formylglycine-generating enzyme required for sulfatase activity